MTDLLNTGERLYGLYVKRMMDLNLREATPWDALPEHERHVWDQMVWDLPDTKQPDRALLKLISTICSACDGEYESAINRVAGLIYEHLPKNSR